MCSGATFQLAVDSSPRRRLMPFAVSWSKPETQIQHFRTPFWKTLHRNMKCKDEKQNPLGRRRGGEGRKGGGGGRGGAVAVFKFT